ncbi:MAG: DMT family transporter [Xanthomonadales bacterium]|nr:DMT family transporter [Xanthomonadales bacterium]
MVLAGTGIPIMAALNSGLGARLGNPVQAATLLFALALVISLFALMLQSRPVVFNLAAVPPQYLLGGLFVAFYVLSVTFIAPKIGVGNSIVLVLLGQMLASAMIDHFGWLNAPQASLSSQRVAGLVVMAIAVVLMRRPIES